MTQPERADIATVSSRAAVVVVRCTRASLLAPGVAVEAIAVTRAPHG
ncbi:hypothetical protein [Streptomyces sp. enrichment culture]